MFTEKEKKLRETLIQRFIANAKRLQKTSGMPVGSLWFYRKQYQVLLERAESSAKNLLFFMASDGISFDEKREHRLDADVKKCIEDTITDTSVNEILGAGNYIAFFDIGKDLRKHMKEIAYSKGNGEVQADPESFWNNVFSAIQMRKETIP